MEAQEFVLAIVAMAIGGSVVITAIVKGVDLIKSWITRNNSSYDEEKFDRLAKAFIQYKKESQRRFQNIETIITVEDADALSSPKQTVKQTKSQKSIELQQDDEYEEQEADNGNLKNMLNSKKAR